MAHHRTWSQWLGIDEQSKAEARAKKEQELREKHGKAVQELRGLMDSEEGRLCGKQLAEGAPAWGVNLTPRNKSPRGTMLACNAKNLGIPGGGVKNATLGRCCTPWLAWPATK